MTMPPLPVAGQIPPSAALIDLDGTLVDTLGDFVAALTATFTDLGLPPPRREQVARAIGQGSEHLLRTCLVDTGMTREAAAARLPQAWARYQAHYRQINGRHAVVLPGVTAGLVALSEAGWRLACVTNKPGEFADALLQATGLRDPFALVLGGDALPLRKPHPAPLLEACRRLGVGPACAVMIGDSSNDAQAARAAGCRSVLVRGGYNHGEPLETAGADALAETFSEAVSLLRIAA